MFGGILAAISLRGKKTGNGNGQTVIKDGYITKADLLQFSISSAEIRQEERRAMYARMDAIVAEFKLSMREYDGNMAEFVKSANDRLRALERAVDRYMGSKDQR